MAAILVHVVVRKSKHQMSLKNSWPLVPPTTQSSPALSRAIACPNRGAGVGAAVSAGVTSDQCCAARSHTEIAFEFRSPNGTAVPPKTMR